MKLGVIGLPWFLVGTIHAIISAAIGLAIYQVGGFISVTYPTLWIIPILCNIFAFINGMYAGVALTMAVIGLVVFVYSLFAK